LELGDFEVAGGNLSPQLLFADLELVNFLASSQRAVVDGGDESEGDGVNGVVNVRVCVEEYLCCPGGDQGKLLFSFLVSHREAERWWVIFCNNDMVGEGGSSGFGGGREVFFIFDKSGEVFIIAGDGGGAVGRGRQFIG